jgi:hypothetical protein
VKIGCKSTLADATQDNTDCDDDSRINLVLDTFGIYILMSDGFGNGDDGNSEMSCIFIYHALNNTNCYDFDES